MGGLDGQKMGNILSEVDTPGTRVPVDIIGKLLALSFQRVSYDFPTNKQTNKQTIKQTNTHTNKQTICLLSPLDTSGDHFEGVARFRSGRC